MYRNKWLLWPMQYFKMKVLNLFTFRQELAEGGFWDKITTLCSIFLGNGRETVNPLC